MTNAPRAGQAPSTRVSRGVALALISLAQLMITLDSTIVSVALPAIQDAVDLSDAGRQWTVTAYTLAFGGLLLLGGRVGDLIGRKQALLIGVAGFVLASVLGGAAVNVEMLLGARALQGVFAALIAPSTLSLITTTFTEPRERAKALGVYAACAMSGGALGLVLGGVLTDYLNWRWCLFVNVPLGAAVLIGVLTSVPTPPREGRSRLDVPGAVLSSLAMLGLIYGFGEAAEYGWSSWQVIGALAAAALLMAVFLLSQSRVTQPLLPLRVLANRDSAAAFLAMGVAAFCTYGMLLGMTYQFQTVMGYSPLRTGLAFLGYVGTAVVFSTQVARWLVARAPLGPMIASGLGVFAVALLLLTRLTPESDYLTDILPALMLFGIGVGTLTVPAMTTVMTVTESRDSGVASAIINTVQQAGGSVGAALLNTISISAAATYLASRDGDPGSELSASVHGFVVASRWSVGIALATALVVLVAVRVRTGPQPRAVAGQRENETEPADV
ncbi:MFS transporter [Streptomyces sp. NBRC 109706]|uniref:MFS transporter n=1 Tax=Streptomyces sp. NBRC 109706 TaxID=1550035 RepID=UPI000780F806|nr:MFS transporter [Streptomyces sp. NBRC 109706]